MMTSTCTNASIKTDSSLYGGDMNRNLKISNLPQHYNDMDIISGLKQLINPISKHVDFKKIIFNRGRSGKVSLFVKFANKQHLLAAYSNINNNSMGGNAISVEYTQDGHIPKAPKSLSNARPSTMYRAGFIVQNLQNGKERMTTIIPHNHHNINHNSHKNGINRKINGIKRSKTVIKKQHKLKKTKTAPQKRVNVTLNIQTVSKATAKSEEKTQKVQLQNMAKQEKPPKMDQIKSAAISMEPEINKNNTNVNKSEKDVKSVKKVENAVADIDAKTNAVPSHEQNGADLMDIDDDKVCNSPIAAHFNDDPSSLLHYAADYSIKKKDSGDQHAKISTNINFDTSHNVVKKAKRAKKSKNNRLFIQNINANIGDNQLKTKFEKFGSVATAKIMRDPKTNASKGCGFVTFKSAKSSKRAINAMHNTPWYNQQIRVSYVHEKTIIAIPLRTNAPCTPCKTAPPSTARLVQHKPRDPRKSAIIKSVHKPLRPPPAVHVPVTQQPRKQILPQPPPPQSPAKKHVHTAAAKPLIVHNFSQKQTMELIQRPSPKANVPITPNNAPKNAPEHVQKRPPPPPPPAQVPVISTVPPNNGAFLPQIQAAAVGVGAFYGRTARTVSAVPYFPQQRFAFCMPRIVSSTNSANIQNPPVISQSFTTMTQHYQQIMAAAQRQQPTQTQIAPVAANAAVQIKWEHGLLLGSLPDAPLHKLRFYIEQNAGNPVTKFDFLKKQIAVAANNSSVFTAFAIFDSQQEMQNAFEKMKGCVIAQKPITCDIASKYMPQIKAMFGTNASNAAAAVSAAAKPKPPQISQITTVPVVSHKAVPDSDIKLKSMSISRSPTPLPAHGRSFSPASSQSMSVSPPPRPQHSEKEKVVLDRDRDRHRHRDRDRDRDRNHRHIHQHSRHDHRERDRSRDRDRDRRHKSRRKYSNKDEPKKRASRFDVMKESVSERDRRHIAHRDSGRDRDRDRHRGYSRHGERDRDRDRGRVIKFSSFGKERGSRRHTAGRSRAWSRSRSRSRSWSRSRSRSRRKEKARKRKDTQVKSRCVVISCSGNRNARDLTETEISNFVGGSIARIIKRVNPGTSDSGNALQCQLFFYIKFENVESAAHCALKLKEFKNFHCYTLTVQLIDEKTWDSFFPASDGRQVL